MSPADCCIASAPPLKGYRVGKLNPLSEFSRNEGDDLLLPLEPKIVLVISTPALTPVDVESTL